MRAPWSTLFEGYEDHWLLAQYLDGDEPDWSAIYGDGRLVSLSTGEKVLLDVAFLFSNRLLSLDKATRVRIATALLDLP